MKKMKLADGLTVAYKDEGQGAPVVLLHGYCGSSRYWDKALPLLAKEMRIIAPDARGHGDSGATEGVYSMELLADDVERLLDALQLPKAYVLGHSMGGYTALAFAEKHPDRLLGVGLVHSTAYPDDEAGKAGRLKVAERVEKEGVRPFIDELVPKLFAPEHRNAMPDELEAAKRIGYGTSAQGAIGCALGMRERPDRRHVLEQVRVPALLLAGEADAVVPPEKRFPVDRPNVVRHELKGAGHMSMMEAPEAFAQAVVSFVREAEKARASGREETGGNV